MFGHPALRMLIRLKFRGALRQQVRRLKRPSSWIFMILGSILILFWLSTLFISSIVPQRSSASPEVLMFGAQAGMLILCAMTVVGAFSHRGLYLPKEEIELCFSGPLTRGDLVRYRLLVNLLRSLFTGVIFGIGAARRMPVAAFGFAGAMMAIFSVPILGQAAAILLGDTENRLARAVKKWPIKIVTAVLGILIAMGIGFLLFGNDEFLGEVFGPRTLALISSGEIISSPFVQSILWPFKPWALMLTATSTPMFVTWLLVCAAMWLVGFELTARIPVDFRELSLATSADVAKRLKRVRRGWMGASGADVSKTALSWRVPWILGRGSFGAIAWLKLASIVRKARGTMLMSTLIIAFVTLMFTTVLRGRELDQALGGAAILAGLGTIYLCLGLRFDFRGDLDLMETIKAWPVKPWQVFLATILPEVLLVSALLTLGILARAAFTQCFYVEILAVIAFQPQVTLCWVALDNAVFLYSPVRYTPGQEGALQHMGRAVVLMFVRMIVLLFATAFAGAPVWFVLIVYEGFKGSILGLSLIQAVWLASPVCWLLLLLVNGALVALGGKMLKRFDVARDKG